MELEEDQPAKTAAACSRSLRTCPANSNEPRTMAAKRRFDNTILPVSETSDESFWEVAAHERDPKKNSKITQQIDHAIREHERNVSRGRMISKKPWQL
jgi:hypothetical protein